MASGRHTSEEVKFLGERPAKRPRTTASLISGARYQEGLNADLQSLPDAEAKKILIKFAPLLPELAKGVKDHCDRRILQESQLIRKYDSQVQRARELANREITKAGSYDKDTILAEVTAEIESMLKQIVAEIKPHSSYQSKFNAADSLLKIFEAVLYESGETCRELIYLYRHQWGGLFCNLVDCFNNGELRALAAHPAHLRYENENVGWLGRFQEFVEEAQRFSFVPGVEDAYQTLCDAVSEDHIEDEGVEEEESLEEDEEEDDAE
ncbi:hypothetical protein PG984_005114 [Apiospora sp. TS-2023a]